MLKPGGAFLYVVPSALHLWEMKEILYQKPYENPVKRDDYPGFVWQGAEQVRYTAHLDCSADIMALFGMTPYAWKTPRRGLPSWRRWTLWIPRSGLTSTCTSGCNRRKQRKIPFRTIRNGIFD